MQGEVATARQAAECDRPQAGAEDQPAAVEDKVAVGRGRRCVAHHERPRAEGRRAAVGLRPGKGHLAAARKRHGGRTGEPHGVGAAERVVGEIVEEDDVSDPRAAGLDGYVGRVCAVGELYEVPLAGDLVEVQVAVEVFIRVSERRAGGARPQRGDVPHLDRAGGEGIIAAVAHVRYSLAGA